MNNLILFVSHLIICFACYRIGYDLGLFDGKLEERARERERGFYEAKRRLNDR